MVVTGGAHVYHWRQSKGAPFPGVPTTILVTEDTTLNMSFLAKCFIALPNHKEEKKQSRLKLQRKGLKTQKGCRQKQPLGLYQALPAASMYEQSLYRAAFTSPRALGGFDTQLMTLLKFFLTLLK